MLKKLSLLVLTVLSLIAVATGQTSSMDGYRNVKYVAKAGQLIKFLKDYDHIEVRKDRIYPAKGYVILIDKKDDLHFLSDGVNLKEVSQNGSVEVAKGIAFICFGCRDRSKCTPELNDEGSYFCLNPCRRCKSELLVDSDAYRNVQIAMGPL